MSDEKSKSRKIKEVLPSVEEVQGELSKAKSMDDFFRKEGIFAKLFAHTIEEILETELSEHLGYEPYEVKVEILGTAAMVAMGRNCARPLGRPRSRCHAIVGRL